MWLFLFGLFLGLILGLYAPNILRFLTRCPWLCLVGLLSMALTGCATPLHMTTLQVAPGVDATYVQGTQHLGVLGDDVMTNDRYDAKGNLVHPESITVTGTVHGVIQSAAGASGAAQSAVAGSVMGVLVPSTAAVSVKTGGTK